MCYSYGVLAGTIGAVEGLRVHFPLTCWQQPEEVSDRVSELREVSLDGKVTQREEEGDVLLF